MAVQVQSENADTQQDQQQSEAQGQDQQQPIQDTQVSQEKAQSPK